jgi:outer membrane protein OmpA-like peptidoglycan-associated protein
MNKPMQTSSFRRGLAVPAILASVSILLTACADMSDTQRRTGAGAGIGAVAGAVVGSATGNNAGRGALIGGALGAVAGNIWSHRMEEKKRALEQATQGTGMEVSRTADNQLKLNVPADVSFDVGRADIKPQLREVLDQFAQGLQNQPAATIRVIGHADSTGSDETNDHLSAQRAQSVRNFLVDRGVSGGRIDTAGRGSREPIASNESADGRARNRRVEIFLSEAANS